MCARLTIKLTAILSGVNFNFQLSIQNLYVIMIIIILTKGKNILKENISKQKNLLSKKCVTLWKVQATMALIIFAFVDGGLFVFFPKWALILGIVGIVVYVLVISLYLPLLYRYCGYFLEKNVISLNSGVLVHRQTKISVSKVQYCVISQNPLQRVFRLCSVRLLMSGSFENIRQISVPNAYKLKNCIENRKADSP